MADDESAAPTGDGPQSATVDKVRGMLQAGGFPLEMRTARAFRRGRGLNVAQSQYYIDEASGIAREIDVVAHRHVAIGTGEAAMVSAVVECKRVPPSRPWVGFLADQAVDPAFGMKQRVATVAGQTWLQKLLFVEQMRELPLFQMPQLPAYSLTQLNQERGVDRAYMAMTAVTQAAVAYARYETRSIAGMVQPVIVLSGSLFVAQLTAAEELEVQERDRLQVLWRNPVGDAPVTTIDVVTEAALPTYVEDFAATANAMVDQVDRARRAIEDVTTPTVF